MRTIGIAFAAMIGALAITAAQETVYRPGDGVSLPRLVKQVYAEYTDEARAARIQGTVVIEAIVQADGAVGTATVIRSLDARLGLDKNAVEATKQCIFEPGKKDGKPVAVRITMEHTFTLK